MNVAIIDNRKLIIEDNCLPPERTERKNMSHSFSMCWRKQIGHRYELLWKTHKEINSDINQMFNSNIVEKKAELKLQLTWKDHFSNMNYFVKFLSDFTTGKPEPTKICITPNLWLLSTVCGGTQQVSGRYGFESHWS